MGDQGIDVANHQMGLDWGRAREAGLTFGWFKLTEGIGYVDPWSDEHQASARAAGMAHGAYHFARPDTNTPEQDADWFSRILIERGLHQQGHLPPVLDFEDPLNVRLTDRNCVGAGSMREWAARFLVRLADRVGRRDVVLYASTSMIADRLGGEAFLPFAECRLWVAHYGRTAGAPGWHTGRVVAHQYTETGRIPGWRGGLDLNTLLVPLADLLGGGSAHVTLPPAPPGTGNAGVWPLPPGEYFGPITGPRASHGGYYPAEREHIRRIQRALVAAGVARRGNGDRVTNAEAWSDGTYGPPTVEAVKAWQRRVGHHVTGNIWPDDWNKLLA